MAIVYCDFINGDDTTGDGSSNSPYKTITKASTGLTGGDEVRVAKSSASTNLTGTLGFTVDSTAVTGASTLFTSELAIGDFIKGGDGYWYEVITITDDENVVLFRKYPNTTGAGVSSQKLGITSTGEASSSTAAVQAVSASGSSLASRLKISGGWDLGTTTQDGQTYFRQMHGTFATRYGYGLVLVGKSYLEIERCHFLRYRYGCMVYNSSSNNIITSMTCLSCGYKNIYVYLLSNLNTITSPICNSGDIEGICIDQSHFNTITSPICNGCDVEGIYMSSSYNNIITSPVCNYSYYGIFLMSCAYNLIDSPVCGNNPQDGIRFEKSINNTVISPVCNYNLYGIRNVKSFNNIINNYSGTGNTSEDISVESGKHYGDYPCAKCQHFGAVGVNKCFYEYGITERNTANARSGECLKYDPSSGIYYIRQNFFFKADSGVGQTLSAYIKDDAGFNGDIQAAIFFMGKRITGWTEWTPTTSYVQQSIVAAAGDITEDGVLELAIKVCGTAGNIFVDDLGTV